MKYEISDNLLQSILDYLTTKPYKEVSGLINGIQMEVRSQQKSQNKPVKKPAENKEKPKKDK
jgi:hypothetical protein